MKYLLIPLFIFILTISLFPQWTQQYSGTTHRFLTCFFLNENIGWAAGDDGTIVKTTNGGTDWVSQSISTLDNIHNIFFVDSQNGWIVLYEYTPDRHGSIMHTSDGGESWNLQFRVWGSVIHTVFFTDVNNGFIVGSSGLIYGTTDGGNNWNFISPISGYWLYSCFFFDPNVGWVGGGLEGYLLRTTNGGQSWSEINSPIIETIMCLDFVNNSYGWACDTGGKIIKTTNAGLDWILTNSGVNVELRDIQFINQNEGWSVGLNGKIIHSSDGGVNWFEQNSGTNYNLYGLYFTDELTGWAVGNNGIILKTINGGLPVELASFWGVEKDGKIILYWTTATEVNNLGFEIERCSEDHKWRMIGFLNGAGTSTEPQEYSYTDDLYGVRPGVNYYRLKQIDFNGRFEYSGEIEVNVPPSLFNLSQNYPNPFNPSTTINYSLAKDGHVTLLIYDVLGNKVTSLVNAQQKAGDYNVVFDGKNYPAGIYYYSLNTEDYIAVKKLVLLK